MICKWCGAAVTAGGKQCSRCGREIPAMSDCGGFYDLVPNPGGVAIPVAVPAAPVAPPSPSPEELARRAAAKKKAEQMALIRLGVFAGVALIIVIMLIVVLVRISGIEQRLDAAEQNVANLDSNLSAHLEEESENPFENLEKPSGDKPGTMPGMPEGTIPPVEKPLEPADKPSDENQPKPKPLDSWSFTVEEILGNNGQMFVEKDRFEDTDVLKAVLPVATGRDMQNGICFENTGDYSGLVRVIPKATCGSYSLIIRISGPFVDNYTEFRTKNEKDSKIAEVTGYGITGSQCWIEDDNDEKRVFYQMKVSQDVYEFFAKMVKDESVVEINCILSIEQTEDGKNQTFFANFQPADGDDENESGDNLNAGNNPNNSDDGLENDNSGSKVEQDSNNPSTGEGVGSNDTPMDE